MNGIRGPKVVPYIAPWSKEPLPVPSLTLSLRGIAYADETPEDRDDAGVLWSRWLDRPRVGRPLLGDVHAPRQRRCMLEMLCQVCGAPADCDDRGWLWLLQDDPERRQTFADWPHDEMTTHPPVCRRCAPIAVRECPHLRGHAVAARVRTVIPDGYYGQRYIPGPALLPVPAGGPDLVLASQRNACGWFLAGQVAATLHDCTIVDLEAEFGQQTPGSRAEARR